jgi:capping protein beta
MKGTWDSIHVVEVGKNGNQGHYKLTSTVMLFIETESEATGTVSLAGSLTRQEERDAPVDAVNTHIVNIGRIMEEMEGKLRTALELIYFGKTKEVYNSLRSSISSDEERRRNALTDEMNNALGRRGGPHG